MPERHITKPPLHIETADNFIRRFIGLMGRKNMPDDYGLLIYPCNSIHMCFMRFAIDAVYLDKQYTIIKIVENLRPWLGISACWKARAVLEVAAGTAERYKYVVGMKLPVNNKTTYF
nr:DUF192 domain-containing protein [Pectinatus sottacetonis]